MGQSDELQSFQLNLRISESYQKKLETCARVHSVSKGEIVRRGIDAMCERLEYVKKIREERDDWEIFVIKEDEEVINKIERQIYIPIFREVFAEKWEKAFSERLQAQIHECFSDNLSKVIAHASKIAESAASDAFFDYVSGNKKEKGD